MLDTVEITVSVDISAVEEADIKMFFYTNNNYKNYSSTKNLRLLINLAHAIAIADVQVTHTANNKFAKTLRVKTLVSLF